MPRTKNLNPVCRECGLKSSDLSLYKKSYGKNGHTGYCNLCLVCAYKKNKDSIQASDEKRRAEKRDIVRSAKSQPCTDCGNSYPYYVMQFDHLPDFEKAFNVSQFYKKTVEDIRSEISKCEIVCANCHAIRTHDRLKKGL